MYTKNYDPWAADSIITVGVMNNFESIYTQFSEYTHTHDGIYYTKSIMDITFWYAGNDGPDSGADFDYIQHGSFFYHASQIFEMGIPEQLIILWYGGVDDIPTGWHLCNGEAGTVNLLDRFVVGAGGSYDPGATGGAWELTVSGTVTVAGHALTIDEMPSHNHPYTDEYCTPKSTKTFSGGSENIHGSYDMIDPSKTTTATGGGQAHGHPGSYATVNSISLLPPYYALCYIQKVAT